VDVADFAKQSITALAGWSSAQRNKPGVGDRLTEQAVAKLLQRVLRWAKSQTRGFWGSSVRAT